jgi:PleD family two-component response regulator
LDKNLANQLGGMTMSEIQHILVVEDDMDTSEMLSSYFEAQGYDVLTAAWGEDALRLTEDVVPDLVVLDIRLPDIDGYEVCRRLRSHRRTEQVPIIFLTERRERTDRLTGLELGAVDYITKPFDMQELRLRVRNALRRASLGTLVNPITGLPTDPLIDERLADLMRQKDWALLCVGLRGLRDFSDSYGFVASDDVLRAVALMIKNVVKEMGDSDRFVGHLGEADFIILSTPSETRTLRERVTARLEQAIDYFYPLKDREQQQAQRPQISLLVGVVMSKDGPFETPLEVKVAALQAQS